MIFFRGNEKDPCNQLMHMDDGTYILNSNLTAAADYVSAETSWAEHEHFKMVKF